MTRVSAIIPAFNESATIADVVRTVKTSPLVDEVVVVSDGSTDDTAEAARQAGAHVLNLPVQSGKGHALQVGVEATLAPVLLFLDADLCGITPAHLEQILRPVLDGRRVMNIGLRDRGAWFRVFGPRLLLISGERALKREVFTAVSPRHLKGYMIEAALNFACRSRGWAYGTVFLDGLSIRTKVDKVGWWRAVPQYAKMGWQVAWAMLLVRIQNNHRGVASRR